MVRQVLLVLGAFTILAGCGGEKASTGADVGGNKPDGVIADGAPTDGLTTTDGGTDAAVTDTTGTDADAQPGTDAQVGTDAQPGTDAGETDADDADAIEPDGDADGGPEEIVQDVGDAADTAGDATAACPGQPGCDCQTNTDCPGSACIDRKDGSHVCATPCPESTGCATGEVCRDVSQINSMLMVCVEADLVLCDPCAANADCQLPGFGSAVCVVHADGAGSFCGYNCKDTTECPGGYTCQAGAVDVTGNVFGRCLPTSGVCACSPRAGQKDLETACGIGACTGKRSCTIPNASLPLEPTLTACAAPGPGLESCNGVDDDCDGQTDEDSAGGCDDKNPCTADACTAGQCSHGAVDGGCDDQDACTVGDACGGGVCLPGTVTVCVDTNPCTSDACNPASGCTFLPNSATCSDGDACTSDDVCKTGACQAGAAVNCDDANPCTQDSCVPSSGCAHSAASGPCSDGSACTIGDTCQDSACLPGAITSCDDSNPCTTDSCDPAKGCVHLPGAGTCTDGNACTVGDACQGGACLPGSVTTCDDSNPCTDDSCAASQGCVHLANAVTCSDGDGCTVGDTCGGGVCKGAPRLCDDANACTQDACSNGACTATVTPGCTSCLSETFPMAPVFAGVATTDSGDFVHLALTAATEVTGPFALGASWTGSGTDTGVATATWTLPAVSMAKGTTLQLWIDATLGDAACGQDDVEVRVGGVAVQTVCATTAGPQKLTIDLPLPDTATPVTVEVRVLAGKGAGHSGSVVIDDVAIGGNCAPLACGPCAAGQSCNKGTGACEYHVVLSEVATQGPTSASDEFIELYNPGDTASTLTGLLVQYRASTSTTNWINKVSGGIPTATIAAHGYFLIASKSYVGTVVPDVALTVDMGIASAAGSLQLIGPTATLPLDLLGYGDTLTFETKPAASSNAIAAGSLERKAHGPSTAATMAPGGVDQGAGNGYDSDVNLFDWLVRTVRLPQNKASGAEPAPI